MDDFSLPTTLSAAIEEVIRLRKENARLKHEQLEKRPVVQPMIDASTQTSDSLNVLIKPSQDDEKHIIPQQPYSLHDMFPKTPQKKEELPSDSDSTNLLQRPALKRSRSLSPLTDLSDSDDERNIKPSVLPRARKRRLKLEVIPTTRVYFDVGDSDNSDADVAMYPKLPDISSGSGNISIRVPRRNFASVVLPTRPARVKSEPTNSLVSGIQEQTLNAAANDGELKIKQECILDEDSVRARLADAGFPSFNVELDSTIRDASNTREFFSKTYGGNPQSVHPKLGGKFKKKHPFRRFMYLNTEKHPNAPRVPGELGIYVKGVYDAEDTEWEDASNSGADTDADHEMDVKVGTVDSVAVKEEDLVAKSHPDLNKGYRLIVKVSARHWRYMGQYHLIHTSPLDAEEWQRQDPKFKNAWMADCVKYPWGRDIRWRVGFKLSHGRDATLDEIENAIREKLDFPDVTVDQIQEAFCGGSQRMYLRIMKPIGYEEKFQHDVTEKLKTWVEPSSSQRKPNKGKPAHNKLRSNSRRKREERNSTESGPDSSYHSVSDDD